MKNWYKLKTIRRSLNIIIVSALTGSLQMALFLPDGVSYLDRTSSLLEGILNRLLKSAFTRTLCLLPIYFF